MLVICSTTLWGQSGTPEKTAIIMGLLLTVYVMWGQVLPASFEDLGALIFMGSTDFIGIFYVPRLPSGTMCVVSPGIFLTKNLEAPKPNG